MPIAYIPRSEAFKSGGSTIPEEQSAATGSRLSTNGSAVSAFPTSDLWFPVPRRSYLRSIFQMQRSYSEFFFHGKILTKRIGGGILRMKPE